MIKLIHSILKVRVQVLLMVNFDLLANVTIRWLGSDIRLYINMLVYKSVPFVKTVVPELQIPSLIILTMYFLIVYLKNLQI